MLLGRCRPCGVEPKPQLVFFATKLRALSSRERTAARGQIKKEEAPQDFETSEGTNVMGMQNFIAPDLDLLKATHLAGGDDQNRSSANESFDEAFEGIIGTSPTFQKVLDLVRVVAPIDSTVLILGETGTGKELIAQALHRNSPRNGCPFIKMNCSAIPAELLESELFGHEKGAFTGAISQKVGRFEIADTGTLFLDEIGDMPLALQPKVLRLLQEQEFERLGSCRTRRINVRLIAATNRDLDEMIGRNEFRTDLYYRLNVFPIVLPPLRERREDIAPLVAHFAGNFANRLHRRIDHIPRETMDALSSYAWPGNVRELQNLVERAVILCHNGVLSNPLDMLRAKPLASVSTVSLPVAPLVPPTTFMDSQRAVILQALDRTEWAIGGPHGAAAHLGLKRTTLISKMKKLGISRPSKLATRAASPGIQA